MAWGQSYIGDGDAASERPCESGQVCWLLELSPGVDGGPVLAGGSVVDTSRPREGIEVLEGRGKCSRIGRSLLSYPSKDGGPLDKETTIDAMAAEETPVLAPASIKAEFFDEVFENGLPDMEKVEKEVDNAPPKGDIEALLEELFESEPAVTASSEVAALPQEVPKKGAGDSSDKEDEELEDESLVKHYLQVVKPTVNSKLHLPLPEYRINALGASRPVPKCGARGDYDYIAAEEHLSTVCSYKIADSEGAGIYRCSRRCSSEGEHGEHYCAFHK